MDSVYIVVIDNPAHLVADNPGEVRESDIFEVFDRLDGAQRYLRRLGFKPCLLPSGKQCSWSFHGQSPWFDQPEDDENIVNAYIVERHLTCDFKGEDREFEALMLGDEFGKEDADA